MVGLPLDLWEREILKEITSSMGRFMEVHKDTLLGNNLEVARVKLEQPAGTILPSKIKIRCSDGEYWVKIRLWKQFQEQLSWVEVVKAPVRKQKDKEKLKEDKEKNEEVERLRTEKENAEEQKRVTPNQKEKEFLRVNRNSHNIEETYVGETERDLTMVNNIDEAKKIWEWVEGTIEEKFNKDFMGSPDPFSIWALLGGKPSRKLR